MEGIMRGSHRLTNDIKDLCLVIPDNTVGIEIGCFAGESTKLFLESGKFQRLYCVDPWSPEYYKAHNMKVIEAKFDEATKNHVHIVKKIKMTSREVAALMTDPYINFVYIDGDHSYQAVADDIKTWLYYLQHISKQPRAKILAGHDYKHHGSPGVERAVKELLKYPDIRFAGYSWAKIIDRYA